MGLATGLGGVVFVLHLSRIGSTRLFPAYERIGRALMHLFARQQDGQLFAMANGDLVVYYVVR